jgi:hypothetical protein
MKRPQLHLSYANVVSTLCLFILLGGGALAATKLAKNSVGPGQLRKNAVRTAKITNEAVTSAKIKRGTIDGSRLALGTIGTVPSAQSAANATHALRADSAAQADNATTAGNALRLGGLPPATYLGRVAQTATGANLHFSGSSPVQEATPGGPLAITVPPGVGFVVVNGAASFADAAASTNVELWVAVDEACTASTLASESRSYGTLPITNTSRQELSQQLAFPVAPGPHSVRLCILPGGALDVFSRTLTATTVAGGPNG